MKDASIAISFADEVLKNKLRTAGVDISDAMKALCVELLDDRLNVEDTPAPKIISSRAVSFVGMVQDVNSEAVICRAPRNAFFTSFCTSQLTDENNDDDLVDVMCHQLYVVPIPNGNSSIFSASQTTVVDSSRKRGRNDEVSDPLNIHQEGVLVFVPDSGSLPKLCSIIEIVAGFLRTPVNVQSSNVSTDALGFDEEWERWYPSTIPGIAEFFAVAHRELPSVDCVVGNHVAFGSIQEAAEALERSLARDMMTTSRTKIIRHMTEVMMGDQLGAEYLLLNVIALTITRTQSCVVGPVNLHLQGIPPIVQHRILHFMQQILASVKIIDFNTNKQDLFPFLCLEKSRLLHGCFQLPAGSHVILCGLEPSVVNGEAKNGFPLRQTPFISNAENEALEHVALKQQIRIPYGFNNISIETNLGLLRLTAAAQNSRNLYKDDSIIPVLACVPWQGGKLPQAEDTENGINMSHELLKEIQWFVRRARMHHQAVPVPGDSLTEEGILASLSDLRQRDPVQYKATTVVHKCAAHIRMSLARSIAASHHSSIIRPCDWAAANALEAERFRRCQMVEFDEPQ